MSTNPSLLEELGVRAEAMSHPLPHVAPGAEVKSKPVGPSNRIITIGSMGWPEAVDALWDLELWGRKKFLKGVVWGAVTAWLGTAIAKAILYLAQT